MSSKGILCTIFLSQEILPLSVPISLPSPCYSLLRWSLRSSLTSLPSFLIAFEVFSSLSLSLSMFSSSSSSFVRSVFSGNSYGGALLLANKLNGPRPIKITISRKKPKPSNDCVWVKVYVKVKHLIKKGRKLFLETLLHLVRINLFTLYALHVASLHRFRNEHDEMSLVKNFSD